MAVAAASPRVKRFAPAAVCAVLLTAAAATVAVRDGAPLAPEQAAHHWAVAHRGEPLLSLARALTDTGTGVIPYLMAVLAGLLAGRGTLARRLRTVLGTVAFLAACQVIRYGLMLLFARPRPPAADWAVLASGHSFPSGHATTSALAAGILAWGIARRTRPAAPRATTGRLEHACRAALALWAVGVGLTRVHLGVHWPGDVLAGWLLATTLLTLAGPSLARSGHGVNVVVERDLR
ncbi:phosphatase PAP2 family protein [Streptomyces sp. NBRC 110611]|uniref:phosphatase PAP2 family protein n=1 Tax=Streptomyces sp. NBRC 110611 TaxID=1621259 RepID=UPI0009A0944E|nr:phosphatase PAP2 family protein [Streptomyces sp. NBRC 110611]